MRLRILQKDIDAATGTWQATTSCVIAQALRRQFKTRNVSVGYTFGRVRGLSYHLDAAGRRIAFLPSTQWHTVKPQAITLTAESR